VVVGYQCGALWEPGWLYFYRVVADSVSSINLVYYAALGHSRTGPRPWLDWLGLVASGKNSTFLAGVTLLQCGCCCCCRWHGTPMILDAWSSRYSHRRVHSHHLLCCAAACSLHPLLTLVISPQPEANVFSNMTWLGFRYSAARISKQLVLIILELQQQLIGSYRLQFSGVSRMDVFSSMNNSWIWLCIT